MIGNSSCTVSSEKLFAGFCFFVDFIMVVSFFLSEWVALVVVISEVVIPEAVSYVTVVTVSSVISE